MKSTSRKSHLFIVLLTFILPLAFITVKITDVQADNIKATTTKHDVIEVQVIGMVCQYCAQTIEKTFSENTDIKGVTVDLDKEIMILEHAAQNSIKNETITQLIEDAGYVVGEIKHKNLEKNLK